MRSRPLLAVLAGLAVLLVGGAAWALLGTGGPARGTVPAPIEVPAREAPAERVPDPDAPASAPTDDPPPAPAVVPPPPVTDTGGDDDADDDAGDDDADDDAGGGDDDGSADVDDDGDD